MSANYRNDRTVYIDRCESYDRAQIEAVITRQMDDLGLDGAFFAGKRVVVKPNLVSAYAPDAAVTTHPLITETVCRLARERGGIVTVAESGGGPLNNAFISRLYRVTETENAALSAGVELNRDFSAGVLSAPDGVTSKSLPLMEAFLQADVILNCAKLKTHSLTMMTATAKNLFGCVPGLQKMETHARFSDQAVFQSALVDLADAICSQKEVIHFCDAIVGMEGNGPSGGTPRQMGYLLAARNPFCCDTACREILGLDDVTMIRLAAERGLCAAAPAELILPHDALPAHGLEKLILPDSALGSVLTHLPAFLRPRPQIDRSVCVGCGKCAQSCPPHVITIEMRKNGKGLAHIHRKKCLRCFCCQELCPYHAVRIHKNFVFKLVK